MTGELPYRDFYYPLNVLLHLLTLEEGRVDYLHYGLFEDASEPIRAAQERSTALLLSRLPPPPARLLDVGVGLGTTLSRLTTAGYHAIGITPDEKQIAVLRDRFGDSVDVRCIAFESFDEGRFDAVIFQESSQYIKSEALFTKAAALTNRVIVLDEFAMREAGELHRYSDFMSAAARQGFRVSEEVDLSGKAAPTIDYFRQRLPRYRERLIADLSITSQHIDYLIASGEKYREFYRSGAYTYRLLTLSC